ncbi:MAG: putative membrane protein YhiD involved in acid resistance [Paracoccaceae bacterium]|jgi:uncharacterized membrane protein YhiD involved in acid resistance
MDRVFGAVRIDNLSQFWLDIGGRLMAREFGGNYSQKQPKGAAAKPESDTPRAGRTVRIQARLLFFAPLPLLFTGFGAVTSGDATGIIRDFTAFVILIAAPWMLREGLIAHAACGARPNAQRPALPRKTIAAVLCGLGVGIATLGTGSGLLFPAVLAVFAILLHLFAFGIDALQSKGQHKAGTAANRRVARAIDTAEGHVKAMQTAIAELNDRKLTGRLNSFVFEAQEMFRTVEDDPRDLNAARKYLSVYLKGARAATLQFAELYQKTNDPAVRADYEALLSDLEKNFAAQQEQLLLDDRSELDVEIEVLRERLRHEGVAT